MEAFEKKFSEPHPGELTINKDTMVEALGENERSGKVWLKTVDDDARKDFDHVILALPARPLRELSEAFPGDIRRYVNGVIAFPLLKAFAVIKNPWWVDFPEPQQGAHLVPTREVHYFKRQHGGSTMGMIMFYTDRPATAYWSPCIYGDAHTEADVGARQPLKHELALQIAHLLPRDNNDAQTHLQRVENSIVNCAIRDWSHAPFGAGCHAWAPKIDVVEALGELKAFSLKGKSGRKNVHICGEAYSDYQGFIEGALRSAKKVLDFIKASTS